MEELEKLLYKLLGEIPGIKWIDFNSGQLQEEHPPIAYPAVLISTSTPIRNTLDTTTQQVTGSIDLTLVLKKQETHNKTPIKQKGYSLYYHALITAIQNKLQGYSDSNFYEFDCNNITKRFPRMGIITAEMNYSTSWMESKSTP